MPQPSTLSGRSNPRGAACLSCRNFAQRISGTQGREANPVRLGPGSRIFAFGEFRDDSYFFFVSSAANELPSAASFSISGAIFQRAPYFAS